jgi:tetratricopeptide (TPR) repeat protein
MSALRWITVCMLTALAVVACVVTLARTSPEGQAWLATLPRFWQAAQTAPTIDDAERALHSGNASRAQDLAQRALTSGATDAQADYQWGNIAQRAGDDATAVLAYARGEAADPHNVWNFIALGQLSARLGRLEPAHEQLHRALALAPTMQFLHYDLAMVELAQTSYAEAVRDFDAEIAQSPGYRPAIDGRRKALIAQRRLGPSAALALQTASTASPSAAPSPSPTPHISLILPSPRPRASEVAQVAAPGRTPSHATTTLDASRTPAPLVAQAEHTAPPTRAPITPPPAPTKLPESVIAEARDYLLGVSRDLGFTRALPAGEPSLSTPEIQGRLGRLARARRTSIDEILQLGSSALLSGRLGLAMTAFKLAGDRAPTDWRGPYLAGLVSHESGDEVSARAFFVIANERSERPEIFTSIAIADLELGEPRQAQQMANRAAVLDPTYEPGRFTAGMLALVQNDTAAAAAQLTAASALDGTPARLAYFLDFVSR